MKALLFSVTAVCGLLLVAGCRKESAQLPPDARRIEVVASNGTGVVYLGSNPQITGTNGENIPAVAKIVSVSIDPPKAGAGKKPAPATNPPAR